MKPRKTIVIVGGGVSGALVAYHLLRREIRANVILVDPNLRMGLGLAYSTPSYQHLLNVPAGKISALPEEPLHFLHWLRKNYDAHATESDFAPRAVFGRYIHSLVDSVEGLDHRRTMVLDCQISNGKAILQLEDGGRVVADTVVLATGNFDPAMLAGVDGEAIDRGVYCHSAWVDGTYAGLQPEAAVALIGTGLTAVDVLLRLREVGHRGPVLALSRHGVFPRRHAAYTQLQGSIFSEPLPMKARELVRGVHRAIKAGMDWRAVVDSLRAQTNDLWLALPLEEQKRFHRHLRRRWEVVRHRMAPPIADRIDAELKAGTLVKVRGSLHAVLAENEGAKVRFRDERGELKDFSAARVINCTGPNMNYRRVGSSLFESLFAQGAMVPGPLGAGLWSDAAGALRDREGNFSDILFHVGPGRQGTLIESIAVPELREQAADLANLLIERLASRKHRTAKASSTTGVVKSYELAS
ncbi:MAG TPA: FAD/NAD(P)-binding protein [Edaphobacter sp.]|jgi:hydroxyacylglutathione hydrolase|nr:FAD/NAD(P)-binding protein [Edaphobacter sp.]